MFGIKRAALKPLVTDILNTVDMTKQADQLASQLSSGQKQRLSLAAALIGFPKLMVLDEPTVGLDPVLRERLWKLFRQLADGGTTLLISSHVMEEAERCDDLLLLRDGRVLAQGSPQALCDQTGTKSVEQSFLKLCRRQTMSWYKTLATARRVLTQLSHDRRTLALVLLVPCLLLVLLKYVFQGEPRLFNNLAPMMLGIFLPLYDVSGDIDRDFARKNHWDFGPLNDATDVQV